MYVLSYSETRTSLHGGVRQHSARTAISIEGMTDLHRSEFESILTQGCNAFAVAGQGNALLDLQVCMLLVQGYSGSASD